MDLGTYVASRKWAKRNESTRVEEYGILKV